MPAKESKHTPITFNSKPAPTEPSKPLTAHEKALQVHHLAQAFSVWPELTCSSPLTSLPVSDNICTQNRRAAEHYDNRVECTP